jgi:hypothetical protein
MVRGEVLGHTKWHMFFFRVDRVLRVWRNNKAGRPEALVGKIILVHPRWKNGKVVPLHLAFTRRLEAGQAVTLEIINSERDLFGILELSKEQREAAAER